MLDLHNRKTGSPCVNIPDHPSQIMNCCPKESWMLLWREKDYIHLQVGAWSEDDEGGDGHGKEEYQQKQTVDHQSHLVGGQFSPSGFEKKKNLWQHGQRPRPRQRQRQIQITKIQFPVENVEPRLRSVLHKVSSTIDRCWPPIFYLSGCN